MKNHVLQCACCPKEVVATMKAHKASHSGQIKDLPKGSKNKFVAIVWERLFKDVRVVENAEPHLNSEHTSTTENSSSYLESVVADSDLAVGPEVGIARGSSGDRATPDEASYMATNLVGDKSDERCRSNAEEEAKSETSQRKPLLVEAGRDRADEKVPSSSAETLLNKDPPHQKSSLSTMELEHTEDCAEEANPSNDTGTPPNIKTDNNGISTSVALTHAMPTKESGTHPKSSSGRSDNRIPDIDIQDECTELSKSESREPEQSGKCAQIGKMQSENLKSDLSRKEANEATTTAVLDLDGVIAESTNGKSPQIVCDLPETSKLGGSSDTVELFDETKKALTHAGQLSNILPDKDENSYADHELAFVAPDTVHGIIPKSKTPEPTLTETHDLAFAQLAPAPKDTQTQLLGDTVDGASGKTEVNTHESVVNHSDERGDERTESDSQGWYAANKSAFNQMSEFSHVRSTSNLRINTSAVESTSPGFPAGLSLLSNLAASRPCLKESSEPDEKTETLNDAGNRKDEVVDELQHLNGKQSSFETRDKHENQAVTADHPGMDEGPAAKDNYTDNVSPLHSEPDRKHPRKRKKADSKRRPTKYTIDTPAGTTEPEAKDTTGTEPNCLDGIDKRTDTGTVDIKDAVFICPTCDKAFSLMSSLKKHHGGAHRSKVDESKVKFGLADGSGAISERFDSIEDLERVLASSQPGLDVSAKLAAFPADPHVASDSGKKRKRKRKQSSNETVAPPAAPAAPAAAAAAAAAASDPVKQRGRKRKKISNATPVLPPVSGEKKRGRPRKNQSAGRSSRGDAVSTDATKHVDDGSRPSKRGYRKKQERVDTEKELGEGMKYPIDSRVIVWADNDYWGATIKGYERKRNTIGYSINYDGYAKARRNWIKPDLIAGLMNAEGKLALDEEGAA